MDGGTLFIIGLGLALFAIVGLIVALHKSEQDKALRNLS